MKPVAWMSPDGKVSNTEGKLFYIPLYTQDQLEEARKLGMRQERALWNLSASTQEIIDTHPVKELTDEEIIEVCVSHWINPELWDDDDIDFARAILRKAQND